MNTTNNKRVVYVFIDAANLWEAQKSKRRLLDYRKLAAYIRQRYNAAEIKVFYYDAYPEEGTRSYSLDGQHKFYTFLKKGLKFIVRKKKLKRINIRTAGGQVVQEKGNMDVEMTIDAVHHADSYDLAVFLTGDSDFHALVKYLKSRDKKVFIIASKASISKELRTGADGYTNITQIATIWGGELRHRPKK